MQTLEELLSQRKDLEMAKIGLDYLQDNAKIVAINTDIEKLDAKILQREFLDWLDRTGRTDGLTEEEEL